MRKRKIIKVVAVLMTLCLLLTAFSGSAIQAQAEELGIELAQCAITLFGGAL